jgi:hypothetical protein
LRKADVLRLTHGAEHGRWCRLLLGHRGGAAIADIELDRTKRLLVALDRDSDGRQSVEIN